MAERKEMEERMTEYLYPMDAYDTEVLIRDYGPEWAECFTDRPTDWKFDGYDLLPEGQLLLRFVSEREMTEEEAGEEGHTLRHYYVVRYDMKKGLFTGDFWFCHADEEVYYSFMKGEELFSVILGDCYLGSFQVVQETGEKKVRPRNLGPFVAAFRCDRAGRMHAGYFCFGSGDTPYRIFETGKRTKECHFGRKESFVDGIYLDETDRAFCYVHGMDRICWRDEKGTRKYRMVAEGQNFDGFGMSSDKERLIAFRFRDGMDSLFYRFTNRDCTYGDPVQCVIKGTDPGACIQGGSFCDHYGVFRNGSKLFVIDTDFCTEEDMWKYEQAVMQENAETRGEDEN